MIPALALFAGASVACLSALQPVERPRSARGAAVSLILAASCVGWAAPLSNGWWLGVLGALILGAGLAPIWPKTWFFGPVMAGFGGLHVGWAVVGTAWAGAALFRRAKQ